MICPLEPRRLFAYDLVITGIDEVIVASTQAGLRVLEKIVASGGAIALAGVERTEHEGPPPLPLKRSASRTNLLSVARRERAG